MKFKKYKIVEGDKFLCLKDFIMDDGEISYDKNNVYISHNDGCITDNEGDTTHGMEDLPDFFEHFIEQ